jgi:hypothetical protein
MGKLANLATVNSAPLHSFVYMPPDQAIAAARILVLANLGYAIGAPSALNWGTLAAVLRGLRRASPRARIMITDKICPASSADAIFERIGLRDTLDEEMRVVASDVLLRREYVNPLAKPLNQSLFIAPEAIADFDCVVSVGVFEGRQGTVKGAVNTLYGLLPCDFPLQTPNSPQRHHDIYFTFAPHIDAAILEVQVSRDDMRVLTSSDMLLLDETACRLTNTPPADYVDAIRMTGKQM